MILKIYFFLKTLLLLLLFEFAHIHLDCLSLKLHDNLFDVMQIFPEQHGGAKIQNFKIVFIKINQYTKNIFYRILNHMMN